MIHAKPAPGPWRDVTLGAMELSWEGSPSDATVYLDGRQVAQIFKKAMREKAEAVIDGVEWEFGRESGDLYARAVNPPGRVFHAEKESFWGSTWAVNCASAGYRIKPAGFLSRALSISIGERPIGESRHGSFWANRPLIEVDNGVPVDEGVFLLWVCFVFRQRQGAAAAAAS